MKRWIAHCCLVALVVFGVLTLAVQFGFIKKSTTTHLGVTKRQAYHVVRHQHHGGNNNNNNNNNCSSTSNSASFLTIPRTQAVFLHPGKSAGGTFMYRSRHVWKFRITECHPDPCRGGHGHNGDFDFAAAAAAAASSSLDETNANNNNNNTTIAKNIIISIRDPVDRFVSAFHWKTKTICAHYPNNKLCTSAQAWQQQQDLHPNRPAVLAVVPVVSLANNIPTTVDNDDDNDNDLEARQRYLLFEKYQQNANLLAESLCKNNNGGDDNNNNDTTNTSAALLFEEAQNDVRTIAHMKTSLHDWLADWKNDDDIIFRASSRPSNGSTTSGMRQTQTAMPTIANNIIRPIVLEPGFDLEEQIDDALRAIYTTQQAQIMDFRRGDWCPPRRRRPKKEGGAGGREGGKKRRQRGTTSRNKNQKKLLHVHSSVQAHHPSAVAHTPLSEKGTRCVAQFYRRDYEIIRQLAASSHSSSSTTISCGETCRLALESIWNRRAPLLLY